MAIGVLLGVEMVRGLKGKGRHVGKERERSRKARKSRVMRWRGLFLGHMVRCVSRYTVKSLTSLLRSSDVYRSIPIAARSDASGTAAGPSSNLDRAGTLDALEPYWTPIEAGFPEGVADGIGVTYPQLCELDILSAEPWLTEFTGRRCAHVGEGFLCFAVLATPPGRRTDMERNVPAASFPDGRSTASSACAFRVIVPGWTCRSLAITRERFFTFCDSTASLYSECPQCCHPSTSYSHGLESARTARRRSERRLLSDHDPSRNDPRQRKHTETRFRNHQPADVCRESRREG